jgi:hypothetical protein
MNSSEMGRKGGAARAKKLSAARRRQIAQLGGEAAAKVHRRRKREREKLKKQKEKNG